MIVDISRSHGMPVHIPTCRASSTFAGRLRYTGSQPRTTPLKATFDYKQQSITMRSGNLVEEMDSMQSVAPSQSRVNRRLMLSNVALLGLLSTGQNASAQQTDLAEPVKAAKGLIEDLLEKSKTNKAKNDKDRLDSYYRRNYKDWFDVEKGNFGIGNTKNQLSKELQEEILQWIEKNKN